MRHAREPQRLFRVDKQAVQRLQARRVSALHRGGVGAGDSSDHRARGPRVHVRDRVGALGGGESVRLE